VNLFKKKINRNQLIFIFLTIVEEEIKKGNELNLDLEKKVFEMIQKTNYKLNENQISDITSGVHVVCLDKSLQDKIRSLEGSDDEFINQTYLEIQECFLNHGIYFE